MIMGVSDSKSPDGVKIKGVLEDNRKDQQHLIDFLRDKKFVGSIRPSVYLQTIELPDDSGVYQPIDIVIIKDSKRLPSSLEKTSGTKIRSFGRDTYTQELETQIQLLIQWLIWIKLSIFGENDLALIYLLQKNYYYC